MMNPKPKDKGSSTGVKPEKKTPSPPLDTQLTGLDPYELGAKERYVQVHDFLYIVVEDAKEGGWPNERIAKVLIGLGDLVQPSKIVDLCLANDKQELLFSLIQLLGWRAETEECKKSELVLCMFNETVSRNLLQFALRLLS